jgi:diketogulonate reductase-like aldo/keto reductase
VPLPKSNTPARIISNSQLYDFALTLEDIGKLDALDRGKDGAFVNPKYYPANTP